MAYDNPFGIFFDLRLLITPLGFSSIYGFEEDSKGVIRSRKLKKIPKGLS
jgi:hypothetical protein